MGLSWHARRILRRLQDTIQAQGGGQNGFDQLRAQLYDLRVASGKRLAAEPDFRAAVVGSGLLSSEEAVVLFRGMLASSRVDQVDGKLLPLAEILRTLRPPTCRQRVTLTRAVFDMIDRDRDGLLSREEVIACYRAGNHPDVRRGLRAGAQVQQDMIQMLDDAVATTSVSCGGEMMSFPAFLEFHSSLTAFASDDHFRDTIVAVWVAPVAAESERGFALYVLGAGGGLVANLRSQILSRGLPGVSAFRRGVRNATLVGGTAGGQELTQEEFHAAARLAGADLAPHEMTQAFRHLDRRGVRAIGAAHALRAVRGEINARRADAINEAFDYLLHDTCSVDLGNTDDEETLEPARVAQLFNAEAHPHVVAGVRKSRDVLSEFLGAFDGGGVVGGRVTRTEWWEHHADLSALIPDDDAFCAYLQAVWRTKGVSKTCDTRGTPSSDNTAFNDESRAYGRHRSSTSPTSPNACGIPGTNCCAIKNNSSMSVSSSDESGVPRAKQHSAQEAVPFNAWGSTVPHMSQTPTSTSGRTALTLDKASGIATMCAGVHCLLDRVRGSLAAGGVTGVFQLLKGLRRMDESGNGKVTLSGFKKVVEGAGLGLQEMEVRIVFEHLDERGEGEVSYKSFLRSIRQPLSARRLGLVHQVFDCVDEDADGLVDVEDMAKAFRATVQSEVVDGSRGEEHVQREVLESFAVTDGTGRRCTRDDFIAWMELISSSLPSPDGNGRFEGLVRSCWDLPDEARMSTGITDGCSGCNPQLNNLAIQNASSAACARRPIRVVVTRADGSVSAADVCLRYERPLDDCPIGENSISEKQAEDVRRQLAARGIHAVHVRLSTSNPPLHKGTSGVDTSLTPVTVQRHATTTDLGREPSAGKLRIARLGPAGDCDRMRGNRGDGIDSGLDEGMLSVLASARKRLALRGPGGFLSLSRRLRLASSVRPISSSMPPVSGTTVDSDHGSNHNCRNICSNGLFLTLAGFKESLSDVRCGLTGKDATSVFLRLDSTARGEVPTEAAIEAVRGRLLGPRRSLVRAAFSRLESMEKGNTMGGAVPAYVVKAFDAHGHPEVIARRQSPEDVRKEFMDGMTTTAGVVTRKDFESYYADVSAATPSDAYFILQLQNCWGLGLAVETAAAAASLQPTIAADPPNRRDALAGDIAVTFDSSMHRTFCEGRSSAPAEVWSGTMEARQGVGMTARRGKRKTPSESVAAVLRKLAVEVKGQRAAWGLASLRRALYEADRDQDGFLSLREFRSALASSGARLTLAEIRALFTHLETAELATERVLSSGRDGNDMAPWRGLLEEIRPALSGENLGLVRLAFRRMDCRGEGSVPPRMLTERFDASRHPYVLKGHATAQEMHKELLDIFFAGEKRGDSRITERDFIEHHANLSFAVSDAEDFRQIVTNCWGLDGMCKSTGGSMHTRANDITRRSLKIHDVSDEIRTADPVSSPANRHSAWSWGHMSLSETHSADLTAADQKNTGILDDNMKAQSAADCQDNHDNSRVQGGASCGSEYDDRAKRQGKLEELSRIEVSSSIDNVARGGGVARSDFSEEGGDEGEAGGRARRQMHVTGREYERQARNYDREADLSVRYLMEKVRSELNTRGVVGSATLARRLREMSGDEANYRLRGLGEVDFRRALREIDLPLTESDARRLFMHFEMGSSGRMDPDAFTKWLGGRMSDRRRVVVDEAFRRLNDTSENGELDLERVVDAFDATRHPEVVTRRLTPDEVFKEFVSGFLAGFSEEERERAKVSRKDFLRYYDTVSATVPDDAYFENLLRSSWRIPTADRAIDKIPEQKSAVSPHAGQGGRLDPSEEGDGRLISAGRASSTEGVYSPSRENINTNTNTSKITCDVNSNEIRSTYHLHPNQGREPSYDYLRKNRAAGTGLNSSQSRSSSTGPSEQNRKLRAARLSRTFDSQIILGREGATMDYRSQKTPPRGDRKLPPPAEGGRAGRLAAGAAWTPRGRRQVPDSKVFTSHLGNGLRVARDEPSRQVERTKNLDVNYFEGSRKARVTLPPRKNPVWLPEETVEIDPRIPGATATGMDTGAHERSPFDCVPLAQLACETGLHGTRGDSDYRGESSGIQNDGEVHHPSTCEHKLTPRTHDMGSDKKTLELFDGSGCESQGSSVRSSLSRKDQRDGISFDWWGGATPKRSDNVTRVGGEYDGRDHVAQAKPISDTYRSSLVFG